MITRPMLAANYADGDNRWPRMASPKLDGIRALVIDGRLLSRNFKPIPNRYVYRRYSLAELNGLDGELIFGKPTSPSCYRDTMSAVMSDEGEPDVFFHVFDDFSVKADFWKRYADLKSRVTKLKYAHLGTGLMVVPQVSLECAKDLETFEFAALNQGYEGVMLRDPLGPYKQGRATAKEGWLSKVKRFAQEEARVIGCVPLQENHNTAEKDELGRTKRSSAKGGKVAVAKLGALVVRDLKTGVEFNIGTGFTDEDRIALWKDPAALVTRVVRYKFFALGSKEAPRFPVFAGFRDARDL